MEQKTIYTPPTVKSFIMDAEGVICTSPSVGSESFLNPEVLNLDE